MHRISLRSATKVCELKIELQEKSVARAWIDTRSKIKIVEESWARFKTRDRPPLPPVGIDLTRTVHELRRIVNYPRNRIRSADA